jgi:hypothetical protein
MSWLAVDSLAMISQMMGFALNTSKIFPAATLVASDRQINLHSVNAFEIELTSYALSATSDSSPQGSRQFISVPVNVAYGGVIEFLVFQTLFFDMPGFFSDQAVNLSCYFGDNRQRRLLPTFAPWTLVFIARNMKELSDDDAEMVRASSGFADFKEMASHVGMPGRVSSAIKALKKRKTDN